jgi:ferritin
MKPINESLRRAADEVLGQAEPVKFPAAAPMIGHEMSASGDGASPEAISGLCSMMADAKYNSHAYKQAASELKLAGHMECAKYFKYMGGKWCSLAKKTGSFVKDLGAPLKFNAIPPVEKMPADPGALAEKFFALEKSMSTKMFAFMHATRESDPMVHEFLGHIIDKRVKMEKCARQFLHLVQLAGDDWMGLDHSVKHWRVG